MQVTMKSARSQIACPDYRSGRVLPLSGLKENSLRTFFSKIGTDKEVAFLVIHFRDLSFVSRAPIGIDISRRVKGLVTVNGNNEEGLSVFFGGLERS